MTVDQLPEKALALLAKSGIDVAKLEAEQRIKRLSPRELELFWKLLEETRPHDIAISLGVSPKTIDTHRAGVMRKLGMSSRVGLVRWAIRTGLIAA